jgi:hypothetical protein
MSQIVEELVKEVVYLKSLLREALTHKTVDPCDCGEPQCLTRRVVEALATRNICGAQFNLVVKEHS